MLTAFTSAPGTGGAPAWQLAALGLVYWGGTGGLLVLVWAHRSGRTRVLQRAAAVAGLLMAMWAGVWDIGYHVDNGRDAGPLGNPGHIPLLLGIFLTFAGGVLALGLADQSDADAAWMPLRPGWRVPLGGILLTGCMGLGMAALALDDLWHRIYGQDVTLWSPTHLIYLC